MCSLYLGENLISGSKPINLGVRNIGEIVYSSLPLTDAGLHLLDGSLILGGGIYQGFVDYIAELYGDGNNIPSYFCTEAEWQTSVTTYGVCGKFVYDSANNTVRLPKITGIIEGTTDVTALGDLVEQYVKLPNITGTYQHISSRPNTYPSGSGAIIANYDGYWGYAGTSGQVYNGILTFDASRSSSVYSGDGTDTKIQPQTIKVLYYIVVATSSKTDIQVDIDEIATDLNGKADVDGANMVSSVKNFDGKWVNFNSLVTLSTATAVGTYTLDLSSYLPDDNYNYEVKILFYCYKSGDSEYHYAFYNDIFPQVSQAGGSSWGYTNANVRSNTMCFDMPVSTQRYIIYKITENAAGKVYIRAVGYRRMGTNQ